MSDETTTGFSGISGQQPQGIDLEQLLFDSLSEAVRLTLPPDFQEGDQEARIDPDTFACFYGEFQHQVRDRLRRSIEDIKNRSSSLIFPPSGIVQ